jgi:phospholipid/cholesterol/gamma-HCH transport system permease protein
VSAVFVGAIPIVIGMMFLLGVVFAYLLGDQAQQYGANIFVVDGLLLAILREISPVIVAVLVAGRTGAAITAQIGTMKVTEEIDAITTLGLSPLAVLVIPRSSPSARPAAAGVHRRHCRIAGGMLVTRNSWTFLLHVHGPGGRRAAERRCWWAGQGAGVRHFIALIACRMG